jgi:hypothetical protein
MVCQERSPTANPPFVPSVLPFMDTDLLTSKFTSIFARLKVADCTARRRQEERDDYRLTAELADPTGGPWQTLTAAGFSH